MTDSVLYLTDISLVSGSDLRAGYDRLTPYRKQKVDKLRSRKAKDASIAAGLLLDNALRAAGIDPAGAEFAVGDRGKPFLSSDPSFHFSLSHSGDRVICLVSSSPCGCDIQLVRQPDYRVAEKFFSSEEADQIASCADDGSKRDAFFTLWALKESYVKFTGKGLAQPLSSFAVDLSGPDPELFEAGKALELSLFLFDVGCDYKCACCVSGSGAETPPIRSVPFEELIVI